jgi:ABC-type branched-subunit amino acid transport system substrate-binding protein
MLLAAAAVTTLALAAACGSSSGGTGGGGATGGATGAGGARKTVTVGVLADMTGVAASTSKTAVDGVKAGVVYASRNGYTVKYVVADTATNPTTALSAAQKLVTRDHVTAVIAQSALTFAASAYLTSHRIPVLGGGWDGPEWATSKNMFSVVGALHTTKVATTQGTFFKAQGVTNLGSLGYSVSPLSSEETKAAAESVKAAGIKAGYVNANFPFGSTDVGPAALAMKNAGVDGVSIQTSPNTAFALLTALRNEGVNLKAALLPTGYGGDLLQAGPGALNAAQNVYFGLQFEPVEIGDAATKQFSADLKAAGVSGEPTFAMYGTYTSVGLMVRALKAAGGQPNSASLTTALSNIHDFDALGLYGTHKHDINDRENIVGSVDNCLWITKLQGTTFVPVKNAIPVCGTAIPGKTVSASS